MSAFPRCKILLSIIRQYAISVGIARRVSQLSCAELNFRSVSPERVLMGTDAWRCGRQAQVSHNTVNILMTRLGC